MKAELTLADYQAAARELGCGIAIIMAMAEKESAEGGFYDGTDTIVKRYEAGYFKKLTGKTASTYSEAYALDANNAMRASSWGQFQILGDNCENIGYKDAKSMVADFNTGAKAHLKGFVAFIRKKKLTEKLRTGDYAGIAYTYNGPKYAMNEYDTKLKVLHEKYLKKYPEEEQAALEDAKKKQ